MQVSARHLPMYKFVSVTMKGKFAATAMLLAAGLMPAHAEDNYIFNYYCPLNHKEAYPTS